MAARNVNDPDFDAQLGLGAVPQGPVPVNIPSVPVADLRGVAPAGSGPAMDLSRPAQSRLTASQIDRKTNGMGGGDVNVDLSGMHDAGTGPLVALGGASAAPAAQAPAAPTVQHVKASDQSLVSPESQERERAANANARINLGLEGLTQQQLGEANAGVEMSKGQGAAMRGQLLDRQSQEVRDHAKARQDYADRLLAAEDAESKRVADEKIDPERYDRNLGIGSKIANGFGAIFDGFNSGFNHRAGNATLDRVAAARDRDIRAQEQVHQAHLQRLADMRQQSQAAYGSRGDYADALLRAHANETSGADARTEALTHGASAGVEQRRGELESDRTREKADELSIREADRQTAQHKFVPAHDVVTGALPPEGVDNKAQQYISTAEQKANIPAVEAELDQIEQLAKANGGELPGQGPFSRWAHEYIPGADYVRGADARAADHALSTYGMAVAKQHQFKDPKAGKEFEDNVRGIGSAEDTQRGIARERARMGAAKAGIRAAADETQNAVHNARQQGNTPAVRQSRPAGFTPAGEDESDDE